jgi:membrane protease YdiL (CAAX protease family)
VEFVLHPQLTVEKHRSLEDLESEIVNSMNTGSAPFEPISPPPEPNGFHKIFFGENGIRAGWRLAVFLLLFVALQFVTVQRGLRSIPALGEIFRQAQSRGVLTPQYELIFEGSFLIVAFFAAWIMSRIERRSFGVYGIPLQGAFGKLFWQGALWGLAFETIEMLAIFAFGGFSFGTLALASTAVVKFAVLWAIGMVMVGMYEEFLFRGYGQFTVASGIGFWPAAILLSAAFGLIHLFNRGEGWVGALAVFLFGIFDCLTLRRTGNLWFAIGLHAAADYAETFIYSVPDSGLLATGHLLNSSIRGPRWLTGGTIGPEGSVVGFVLFAIAFAAFNWVYPAKKDDVSQ